MDTHARHLRGAPRIMLSGLACLSLSGCVGYGGLFPITLQGDENGHVSAGIGHLGLALAPGLAVADCQATCLQRAEDGTTCVQYLRQADTVCTGTLGHK